VTRFDSIVVRDEEMKRKREGEEKKQVLGKEGIFGSGRSPVTRRRGAVVNVAQ
jgi:hypothetical protein